MRKIITFLIFFIILTSCANKNMIVIREVSNTYDFTVRNISGDSLHVFIPKIFEIQNKSAQKMRFYGIEIEDEKLNQKSYIPIFDEENNFRFIPEDKEYINPLDKRTYLFFLPIATFPKSSIDSSYWFKYSTNDFPDNIQIREKSPQSQWVLDSLATFLNKSSIRLNFETKDGKGRYYIIYSLKNQTGVNHDLTEEVREYYRNKAQ